MNKFLPTFKNDNKKESFLQWLGLIAIILFTIVFIYFKNQNNINNIKEKRLYTVGIVSGFSRTKTVKLVKYIYSFKNNSFEKEASISNNKYSVGDRMLIVFNPESKNSFLLPYFIDDSIKEPYNGWSKPPMSDVTDSDVIKYLEENY